MTEQPNEQQKKKMSDSIPDMFSHLEKNVESLSTNMQMLAIGFKLIESIAHKKDGKEDEITKILPPDFDADLRALKRKFIRELDKACISVKDILKINPEEALK